MDKKQALKILIQNSYLLADEEKEPLLEKVETMSETDMDAIGKFLATEKKESLDTAEKSLSDLEKLLQQSDEE